MLKPIVAAAILLVSGAALAQQSHMNHGAMPQAAMTPATKAFEEANAKMHKDMAIHYTGDVDVDFVRGMIPHHQGAVDMAKVLLDKGGKDPELRKMAEHIIASQESEIATMKAWLAAHSK